MELPIKPQPHVIEDIEKWPIFKLYAERDKLVQEINKNAVRSLRSKYTGKLDKLLARTIYMEKIRMREDPWNADPQNEPLFWKKIQKSLPDSTAEPSEIQNRSEYLLRKIIERYAEEIAGGFKKKTFLVARRILSFFFPKIAQCRQCKKHILYFSYQTQYQWTDKTVWTTGQNQGLVQRRGAGDRTHPFFKHG